MGVANHDGAEVEMVAGGEGLKRRSVEEGRPIKRRKASTTVAELPI